MANTNNLELDIITNNSVMDIDRVDANMEIIDSAIGGKPSTLKTIKKNIIGGMNNLYDLIVSVRTDKLDKGDVSEDYNTAKKIEDKIKNLDDETVLFDGSSGDKGVITLLDDWDNYKKILFIAMKNDKSNVRHAEFYVDYIIASDNTAENSVHEHMIYYTGESVYKSVCFRETNRNELYVTETASCLMTKIIGIGARQEM